MRTYEIIYILIIKLHKTNTDTKHTHIRSVSRSLYLYLCLYIFICLVLISSVSKIPRNCYWKWISLKNIDWISRICFTKFSMKPLKKGSSEKLLGNFVRKKCFHERTYIFHSLYIQTKATKTEKKKKQQLIKIVLAFLKEKKVDTLLKDFFK